MSKFLITIFIVIIVLSIGLVGYLYLKPVEPIAPPITNRPVEPPPVIPTFPISNPRNQVGVGTTTGNGNGNFPSTTTVGINIGNLAPSFTLNTLAGAVTTLESFRNSKPVILFFWDSLCADCTNELYALTDLSQDSSTALQVLTINRGESQTAIQGALDRLGITFKITTLLDANAGYWEQFGRPEFPFTVFIDKTGVIQFIDHRALGIETLRMFAKRYLNVQ